MGVPRRRDDPAHLDQLETLLLESETARETFVEHSQLHAMLHDYFRTDKSRSDRAEPARADTHRNAATAQAEAPMPRRKRRGGKSSAA